MRFMLFCIIILLMELFIGLAAGMPVPRMYYTNFDRAITEKYHVILEGWPLEKFCSPSEIVSRNEVSVLMTSFESGATRFRKLSPTEFEKWSEERFNATIASTTGPVATVTSSSPLPPDSTAPHEPDYTPPHEPPVLLQSAPLPVSDSHASISNEDTRSSTDINLDPEGENAPPSAENVPPSSTVPAKRKRNHAESRQPLANRPNTFVNTGVTSTNGATVMVNAKTRKPRADKGKRRGPRSK
jgi:hypothetical protein